MKKYGKTIVAAGLMFAVILCEICFGSELSAKAADRSKTGGKKWAGAYMKIINKNKDCSFDLIYFDNDKIPELVAGVDGYWVSMYTYDKKSKEVCTVMDHWGYGAMGNAGYEYIPKKNFLYNINSDYAGAVVYMNCMKMKKNKMVNCYPKELKYLAFHDKNKNGVPDPGEKYTSSYTYYYGKKIISKKKFNSYLKSGERKLIIGNMSYKKIRSRLSKLK